MTTTVTLRFGLRTLLVTAVLLGAAGSTARLASPQNAPNYDMGALVNTLREYTVNIYNPGRSEGARLMGNAIQVSNYRKMWKQGDKVEAHIVYDKQNFITGIYPAKPDVIHAGNESWTKKTLAGTGDWYQEQPTTIGPSRAYSENAMKRWERHVAEASQRGLSQKQLEAYKEVVDGVVQQDQNRGSGFDPKGVKIYYDDRILGRLLGRLDRQETVDALVELGDDLFAASGTEQKASVLRSFMNEEKGKLIRTDRPKREIKGAILVSLRRILEALQDTSDFDRLPAEVREVGGLTRVHGYVLLSQWKDVVLVGVADPGVAPIGLDNLLTAIRNVWKEGKTPEISLDPDPTDPKGPQRSRVHGVPFSCRFACVMLDADYLMKKITMGDPSLGIRLPGFRPLKELLPERPAGPSHNRFWLSPIQPGEGDIQISSEEDVVLFDTGVRLQTEAMMLTEGGLVGRGVRNPLAEEICRAFTERYADIERQETVFRQLHGLFDLVLLAKIWRQLDVQLPILTELAAQVVPEHPVPASFAAVTVVVDYAGRRLGEVSGGVTIRPRFGQRNQLHYDTLTLGRLRAIARELSNQETVSSSAKDLVFSVSQPHLSQTEFEDGMTALMRREFNKASDAFSKAIESDHLFSEAYVMRSAARWSLGDGAGARSDLNRAIELSPEDPDLRVMRLVLLLEMGKTPADVGGDAASRAQVASLYYEAARSAWFVDGDQDGALRALDTSLALSSESADTLVLRSYLCLLKREFEQALQDASAAIRLEPKSAQGFHLRGLASIGISEEEDAFDDFSEAIALDPKSPPNFYNRAMLYKKWGNTANAQVDMHRYRELEIERYTDLIEKEPDNAALYVLRGAKKREIAMSKDAIEDFTKAIEKDPRMPLAYVNRGAAYHTLEKYELALDDATKAIGLDEDFAEAYASRGAANHKLGRHAAAIQDCTIAIGKDPESAYAFLIRGLAKLSQRDVDGAIADWREAITREPEREGLYLKLMDDARQRARGR